MDPIALICLSHCAVTEVELAAGPVSVRHLFLDPAACNTLITLQVRSFALPTLLSPVAYGSGSPPVCCGRHLSSRAGVRAEQVGAAGRPETHHLHARWQKARLLSKLRDVHVSAVGWDAEAACDSTTGYGANFPSRFFAMKY